MTLWSRDEMDLYQQMSDLYRAGESYSQLGRDFGMSYKAVKRRLQKLTVKTEHHVRKRYVAADRCKRCEVLLVEAPTGRDGWCGWCEKEENA
jgi:hypothetical protein